MSVWEFAACVEGYVKANGGGDKEPRELSDAALAELGIEGF